MAKKRKGTRKRKSTKQSAPKSVSFEVVVKPAENGMSVFDESAFPAVENLDLFRAPRDKTIEAARKLERNGINVEHIGDFSISASCSSAHLENLRSSSALVLKSKNLLPTPDSPKATSCMPREKIRPGNCPGRMACMS